MTLADLDTLKEGLKALVESKAQAADDFCGEQREWHLPRLAKAFAALSRVFPVQMLEAIEEARDPYGRPLTGRTN